MQNYDNQKEFTGDEISSNYLLYRPTYPDEVFNSIISYHKSFPRAQFDLAVDVGCGSGQATLPLARFFNKVMGVDVSQDQLARCPKDEPNIDFVLAAAEDMSFIKSGSVDLVTAATAFPWFDKERYTEILTDVI